MESQIKGDMGQPGAGQPQTIQARFAAAYAHYAQALAEGQPELQKRSADLVAGYLHTLQEVQKDLERRGVEAYGRYIEGVGEAPGGQEATQRLAEAYQEYLAALGEVWQEQEKRSREAHQDYIASLFQAQPDAPWTAQEAYQQYARTLQEAGTLPDLERQAIEAQAKCLLLLQEAQDQSRDGAEAAYRSFIQDLQEAWKDAQVPERYEKALRAYRFGLTELRYHYENMTRRAAHDARETLRTGWETENFTIGKHTYFNPDIQLRTWMPGEKIIIGKYCSIADRVVIFTGGMRRTDTAALYPFDAQRAYKSTENTTIGNDVWIGSGVNILGGVQVGDGAILASQAVVFDDVPAFAVAAGNPARVIRYRFSKSMVERLQRIAWWDWPDEKVQANLTWFYKPIQEFADHFDPQEEEAGSG
jgi:acetyltransferase-like isoleucine patch superfamily enzyme